MPAPGPLHGQVQQPHFSYLHTESNGGDRHDYMYTCFYSLSKNFNLPPKRSFLRLLPHLILHTPAAPLTYSASVCVDLLPCAIHLLCPDAFTSQLLKDVASHSCCSMLQSLLYPLLYPVARTIVPGVLSYRTSIPIAASVSDPRVEL